MGIVANNISKRSYGESGYEMDPNFVGFEIALAHIVRYARDENAIPEGLFESFTIERDPKVAGTYGTTIRAVRNNVTFSLTFHPRDSNEIPAYVDDAVGNTEYFPYFNFIILDDAGNGVYGMQYPGTYLEYKGISIYYVEGERKDEAVGRGHDEDQAHFNEVSLEVLNDVVTRFNGF